MQKDCVLELIADYLGAGRTYMGKSFSYKKEYEWWENKKQKPLLMHKNTKKFIDEVLFLLSVDKIKVEDIPSYYDWTKSNQSSV